MNMRQWSGPLVLLLAVALPRLALAAPPADVAALQAAATQIETAASVGESHTGIVVDAFEAIVHGNVRAIVSENNLPAAAGLASDSFRKAATKVLETRVRADLKLPSANRGAALYVTLAEISKRDYALQIVDEWLELGEPRNSASRSHRAVTAREARTRQEARDRAVAARGTRRPTQAERAEDALSAALEAARTDGKVHAARLAARFGKQVSAVGAPGPLRINDTAIGYMEDSGGAGSDNGVVDAGEWVKFTVSVMNGGQQHWYSASAWLRSGHECAWTAPAREVELPELAPGDEASITLQVYLSDECGDRTRVPLFVDILDTHRTSGKAVTLEVVLSVSNVGKGALRDLRIDRDVPGSSVSSESKRLIADQLVEVGAGIELARPGALRALQGWDWSKPLTGILLDQQFRAGVAMEPVVSPSGVGAFGPSDDVDLVVVGKEAFAAALRATARRRSWKEPTDAGGVASLSTWVEYPGVEGAWAPPTKARLPEPVVEAPIAPPTPGADEVLNLLRPHLTLAAREVAPAKGALVAATGSTFDAGIDAEAFAAAWKKRTEAPLPTPTDAFDGEAAKELVEVDVPAFAEPARYIFRHLIWMDLDWGGQIEKKAARPLPVATAEEPEEPEPMPEPEPTPVPRKANLLTASLRFGIVGLIDNGISGIDFVDSNGMETQLVLSYARGTTFRYGVQGSLVLGMPETQAQQQDITIYELRGTIGKPVRLAPRIEAETVLGLGVRTVLLTGRFGAGSTGTYGAPIDLTERLRIYIDRGVSGWVGIGYRTEFFLTAASPVTELLIDSTGLKFEFGASMEF